jgi:molybdenum cofactor cytidylyltransferase
LLIMNKLPVVIVLAGGRGERFAASGGAVHKLQALLAGKPVLDHVLDAVRDSGLAFHLVLPDPSRPGMGDSIAAGVRQAADAAGWLILPGDLPLVRSDTLRLLASAPPAAVTVPLYRGQRGHPVRFDRKLAADLLNLKGNEGAAQVLRAQEAMSSVAFLDLDDAGCVADIDTLDDLRRAEALFAQRQTP